MFVSADLIRSGFIPFLMSRQEMAMFYSCWGFWNPYVLWDLRRLVTCTWLIWCRVRHLKLSAEYDNPEVCQTLIWYCMGMDITTISKIKKLGFGHNSYSFYFLSVLSSKISSSFCFQYECWVCISGGVPLIFSQSFFGVVKHYYWNRLFQCAGFMQVTHKIIIAIIKIIVNIVKLL